MTDEQKTMYTGICMCRNAELALFWQRNQLFTVINLAAIPLLAANPIKEFYGLIAVIGFLISTFWADINYRSREMIVYWHERLALIEPSEDSNLIVYRVFTGRDWEENIETILSFTIVIRLSLPGLFVFGWITVYVVSLSL